MTKAIRKHLSGKSGFTLIELMIVIAIIAILAAVAIPQFMSARDKAKITSTTQSLGALRKAMEMYLSDNDDYPTEINSGTPTGVNGAWTGSLGKYTNVTNLFKAFYNSQVTAVNINAGQGYTIIARASDRNKSPITATTNDIFKPY